MNEQFENLLRVSLRDRADGLDRAAVSRVLAFDYYRPRRQRVQWVSGIAAIGLASALVAVFALGQGASPALAGWTPAPTVPAAGQTELALKHCSTGAAAPSGATGGPVLTDTRGPYTALVYPLPDGAVTCLEGRSVSAGGSDSGTGEGSVAAGRVQTFVLSSNDSSGDALTVIDGRVGAGVTSVTIARTNGIPVRATVSHGWYLAWWPDRVRATVAQITTTRGTYAASLPPQATHGPAPCAGRDAGCASYVYVP